MACRDGRRSPPLAAAVGRERRVAGTERVQVEPCSWRLFIRSAFGHAHTRTSSHVLLIQVQTISQCARVRLAPIEEGRLTRAPLFRRPETRLTDHTNAPLRVACSIASPYSSYGSGPHTGRRARARARVPRERERESTHSRNQLFPLLRPARPTKTMGQSQSKRMDRYVATYEREFERIEADLVRVLQRRDQGRALRAALSLWSAAAVVASVAMAAWLVQRVQQAAPGQHTAQQHAARTAGGLALPFAVAALRWLAMLLLGAAEGRASARAAALEQNKRALVRELKDACRFDTARRLLAKYDPDERKQQQQMQTQQMQQMQQMQQKRRGGGAGPLTQHQPQLQQHGQQQRQPQQRANGHPPSPALLATAGAAAASAVGAAGRAVLPLIDSLANTLIADNPVLLEDVQRAHRAVEEAERVASAVARENEALRARVAELEAMLGFGGAASEGGGGGGPLVDMRVSAGGAGGGGGEGGAWGAAKQEQQQEQHEEQDVTEDAAAGTKEAETTAVEEQEGEEDEEEAATSATGGGKKGESAAAASGARRRRAAGSRRAAA